MMLDFITIFLLFQNKKIIMNEIKYKYQANTFKYHQYSTRILIIDVKQILYDKIKQN